MLLPGASNRRPKVTTITPLQRLNRLAASPWVISLISFFVTALIIRSPGLMAV
jgi:hypothetical protein